MEHRPFRDSVNLRDRLAQRLLGSTNHLPEFFLSDVHTNYINIQPFGMHHMVSLVEIVPFGHIEHTSNVVLQQPNEVVHTSTVQITPTGPTPDQGSTDVEYIAPDLIVIPQTEVELPTPAELINHGGTDPQLANNLPQLENSVTPEIELPSAPADTETAIVSQFGATDPAAFYNGPALENSIIPELSNPPQPPALNATAVVSQMGGTNPHPTEPPINKPTQDTETLRYQAGRLLARVAPRVIHGSADIDPSPTEPNQYLSDTGQLKGDKSPINTVTPPADLIESSGQFSGDQSEIDPGMPSEPRTDSEALGNEVYETLQLRSPPHAGVGIANYRTLSYGELAAAARNRSFSTPSIVSPLTPSASTVSEGVQADPDFVTIIVEPTGGDPIQLRAYLTAFSDNVSMQWKDVSYVGRQDTLQFFQGSIRAVSLGVKVAAFSKADLQKMYSNLNRLVKGVSIGTTQAGRGFIGGPYCKLTVGGWFRRTPCTVQAIKLDSQPADYSWDVGTPRDRSQFPAPSAEGDGQDVNNNAMPMIVDLSMDFRILGDVDGSILSSDSKMFASVT